MSRRNWSRNGGSRGYNPFLSLVSVSRASRVSSKTCLRWSVKGTRLWRAVFGPGRSSGLGGRECRNADCWLSKTAAGEATPGTEEAFLTVKVVKRQNGPWRGVGIAVHCVGGKRRQRAESYVDGED